MTIEVTGALPQLQHSHVDIAVHITATLNVTAFSARQKVNHILVMDVGTGVGSGDPSLVIERERLLWRVPILLALPTAGPLGQVGHIDVDTQTGEVLTDAEHLASIAHHAEQLAAGSTL